MFAVTVVGSTRSGRSNSRWNSLIDVFPGRNTCLRALTTNFRSTVLTDRSSGSKSLPMFSETVNIFDSSVVLVFEEMKGERGAHGVILWYEPVVMVGAERRLLPGVDCLW